MVEMAKLIKRTRELTPFFLGHHVVEVADFFIARQSELHMDVLSGLFHSTVRPDRGPNIRPTLIASLLFWDHGLDELILVLKPCIGIMEAVVVTSRVNPILLIVRH